MFDHFHWFFKFDPFEYLNLKEFSSLETNVWWNNTGKVADQISICTLDELRETNQISFSHQPWENDSLLTLLHELLLLCSHQEISFKDSKWLA